MEPVKTIPLSRFQSDYRSYGKPTSESLRQGYMQNKRILRHIVNTFKIFEKEAGSNAFKEKSLGDQTEIVCKRKRQVEGRLHDATFHMDDLSKMITKIRARIDSIYDPFMNSDDGSKFY